MRRHSKSTRFWSEAIQEPNSCVLACVSRLAPSRSAMTPIIPSGRRWADLVDRGENKEHEEHEEHEETAPFSRGSETHRWRAERVSESWLTASLLSRSRRW